jgi:hypothetical protein
MGVSGSAAACGSLGEVGPSSGTCSYVVFAIARTQSSFDFPFSARTLGCDHHIREDGK